MNQEELLKIIKRAARDGRTELDLVGSFGVLRAKRRERLETEIWWCEISHPT
ncbi:MAG: hypothetical protein ACYTFW_26180 [Planctomycetota bacterium]